MINSIQPNTASTLQTSQPSSTKTQKEEKHRTISAQSESTHAANTEEIARQNKIAQIKEDIANKDYAIDLRKTSEKMALDLLNL